MCIIQMILKYLYSAKRVFALCAIGFVFLTGSVVAQNTTSSPYSYYGLGELSNNTSASSIGMGGTNMAYRGGHILNFNNPASLVNIDSLKFIFNLGMAVKYTHLNQRGEGSNLSDYNLKSLAFGFKVSPRYSTAFSISPYSNLGYNVVEKEKVIGSDDYFIRTLNGTGGLNQLTWSNGLKVTKDLALGVNVAYLFGNNSRDEIITMAKGSTYLYQNNNKYISKGVYLDFGAQYQMDLGKYDLTLAAKYQPKLSVSSKQINKVTNFNSTTGSVRYENTDRRSFDVPEGYSLGFGLSEGKHLWFGGDYLYEKWSDVAIFEKEHILRDRSKLSLGMEYRADDGYARKFLKKMTYRLGGFYDDGYITLRDEKIKAVGLSFGFGLPMAKDSGMLNVAIEFGTSGTANKNLVREDFARITLDVNFFERWFFKRKYN